MTDFQEALRNSFPEHTYGAIVRALAEGVALGDDAVNSLPFMNTPVGKDFRGLIRRAAVMFRVHQLCQAGDLPFIAEFTPMSIGSWHWLEIRSGQCRGYLVRTADKTAFPQDTPNQQDKRHSNQTDLFDDPNVIQLPIPKIYTAWLCYGATKNGALTHALWGLPCGNRSETWLARTDVLNAVRTAVAKPADVKKPKVNPRDVMRFKDEVQQAIEDQQNKSDESGADK